MADQDSVDLLNGLLARLGRGLVQYAVDCWPWTNGADDAELHALEQIAKRQHHFVARIVDLISQRGGVPDFGVFADLSDLNYVSLDYLLGKVIADEQGLAAQVETAQAALRGDAEAAAMVGELLSAEREHLARLRDMAKTTTPAVK